MYVLLSLGITLSLYVLTLNSLEANYPSNLMSTCLGIALKCSTRPQRGSPITVPLHHSRTELSVSPWNVPVQAAVGPILLKQLLPNYFMSQCWGKQ